MYAWTLLLCLGSVVMTQVATLVRVGIFVLLVAVSGLFAQHLHLFEPVLLHHYNPRTGEDELITPADDAFDAEAQKLESESWLERGREINHEGDHDDGKKA